ncbi:MAG: NUDIX domain-containing protein [Bacteroidota bacterium]|nr:NUDIX domain-containing protein [Bacteroidota bacterium]
MPRFVSDMVQVHVCREFGDGSYEHLLLRRSMGEIPYPGIWQVVTGMIEPSETAIEAAARELYEETGIRTDEFIVVPLVSSFFDPVADTVHFVPVFASIVPPGTPVRLSPEHQAIAWLSASEAAARLPIPLHRQALHILEETVLPAPHNHVFQRVRSPLSIGE